MVGRVEIGRPLGAHLALQGGVGPARVLDYELDSAANVRTLGMTGEAIVQIPFPTRRRDVGAVRLASRWFGAPRVLYGEAGLDFVVGHGPSTRRPVFVFGYRWTAIWCAESTNAHGFRFGAEWFALGARQQRVR